MDIDFRYFLPQDLMIFREWFQDEETSNRYSYPSDEWFQYITSNPDAQCWLALNHKKIIALIQIDKEELGQGYLSIIVDPKLRNKGIGTSVLSTFISSLGLSYQTIEGFIEHDNIASIKCFERSGFILSPVDSDGFIRAIYKHSQSNTI